MKVRERFAELLREADAEPANLGLSLRLDFAALVVQGLQRKGWKQKDLARAIGKQEAFVSRIVHSGANCQFDTVELVLSKLDIRPQIVEQRSSTSVVDATQPWSFITHPQEWFVGGFSSGKEESGPIGASNPQTIRRGAHNREIVRASFQPRTSTDLGRWVQHRSSKG